MSPSSGVLPRARLALTLLAAAGTTVIVAAGLAPTAQAATSRPAIPTGLRASSSSAGTYLVWTRGAVSGYAVEQATNGRFVGARTYRIGWNESSFTPAGLAKGHPYYFRVRAFRGTSWSGWSAAVSVTPRNSMQLVRVMTYNSLAASYDYRREGSGRIASISSRLPVQVYLIKKSTADAIAVQEASSCLIHYKSKPCWRQIDSLRYHLGSNYGLANTDAGPRGRYAANYIVYKKSVLSAVGAGGNWWISNTATAAYQVLRANATGAKFLLVSVHLSAPRGHSYDVQRGNETASVVRQAKAYASRMHVTSVVYGGDFNTYLGEWHTYNTSGYTMLVSRLNDALTVAPALSNLQYNSFNGYYRTAPRGGHTLDHIYASDGVALTSLWQLLRLSHGQFYGTIPSDHNPLTSYVQIPY